MSYPPNLISLPLEILYYLSRYLGPGDLLALSATCHYLRSVLNDDWFWQKYTHGGHVSEALEGISSLVEPVFTNPLTIDSLEPLCQNRLHFLKQSRLLSNLREGKFVHHSTDFFGFITDLESLNNTSGQQNTYKDIYLFALDYISASDYKEALKVFNIEREPYVVNSFKLSGQEADQSMINGLEVVGDKLIIKKDVWFDVYKIQVPLENLDYLHSININETQLSDTYSTLIIGNCLFVDNGPSNLQTWDIDSGEKLGIINPTNEHKSYVLGYSEDCKHILFYISQEKTAKCKQLDCCAYDVISKKFKFFSLQSSHFLEDQENLLGLVDSKYAVLFGLLDDECSVTVYNYVDSKLVGQLECWGEFKKDNAKIIKNSLLLLPSLFSVKVLDIVTLETLWVLNLNCSSLTPEVSNNCIVGIEYINRSNLCHILLVIKTKGIELWDLEKRQMFFRVDISCGMGINEHCSKIITVASLTLNVFSFW